MSDLVRIGNQEISVVRGTLYGFPSPYEEDFWSTLFQQRKLLIQAIFLLALAAFPLTSAYAIPFVSAIMTPQAKLFDLLLRTIVCGVPLLAALISIRLGTGYSLPKTLAFITVLCAGMGYSYMISVAGHEAITYYTFSLLNVLVYAHAFLFFDFRRLLIASTAIGIAFSASVALSGHHLGADYVIFAMSPVVALIPILLAASFTVEITARKSFLQEHFLEEIHGERIREKEVRANWLQLIADFLKHEMRNALIGVSSSLDLLSSKYESLSEDKYLERAKRSTSSMRRLLDETSSANNLEQALDSLQLEEARLDELVEDVCEDYRITNPAHEVKVMCYERPKAKIDKHRVTQALEKLIQNALDHGEECEIRVTVDREDGKAIVAVSNLGSINTDTETLFDPFVSTSQSSGNLGLGLYVVKRIAEAHGGGISVDSNDGSVRFTLSFESLET